METMKYLVKQMCLVLLLLGTLLMLWEIPHYQQNAMSHSELVPIIGNKLPSYEIQTFLRHIETRLPYYREEFEQAEKSTG
ncbi:MAG: hypothetical protein KC545_08340, partial [Nitrospira sp.]|nr:hypothetical protein [Nitrospira sp.]